MHHNFIGDLIYVILSFFHDTLTILDHLVVSIICKI